MKSVWILVVANVMMAVVLLGEPSVGGPAPVADIFAVRNYTVQDLVPAGPVFAGLYFNNQPNKWVVKKLTGIITPFKMEMVAYQQNKSAFTSINGVCRISTISTLDFGWLASPLTHLVNASAVGPGGRPCQLWQFDTLIPSGEAAADETLDDDAQLARHFIEKASKSKATKAATGFYRVVLQLWLVADIQSHSSIPLQQLSTLSGLVAGTETVLLQEIEIFEDFEGLSDLPKEVFDIPADCTTTGEVCEQKGVANMQLLNFHDPSVTDIGNQNMATTVGEAYYICGIQSGLRPGYGTFQSSLVTLWLLKVNQTWGKYEQCNPIGPNSSWLCTGGNPSLVGRESPDDLVSPIGGQCLSDQQLSASGVWYSFDNYCRCGLSPVGLCQWSPIQPLRTVTGQCLLDLGLADTCQRDGGFPFNQTSALLEYALFSSSNPCQS